MANAKKCDRCGKFYIFNTKFPVDQHSDYYIGGVMTMTTSGYHFRNYDLCDDCIADFKAFISGSKIVK